MNRRNFVKKSVLASSLLYIPSFLKAFETIDSNSIYGYKRLVVIHLRGGNDGLNTIVPYRNDIYYKNRPKLALSKNDVLNINGDLGFHKSLKPLKELYDQGYVSVLNNVGYPNPNRSHFRSAEIWETANNETHGSTGWIGRYLDYYGKHAHNAIEIDESLSLALKGKKHNGLATTNAVKLYQMMYESNFSKILAYQNSKHLNEHNLGYLYNTMIDAKSSAKYIFEKTRNKPLSKNYPKSNPLANQLKVAAQFINSGLHTKVLYTALGGFDTHVNQANRQAVLLDKYAQAVEAFVNDLKRNNTFKNTLILTFSEFGRRLKQNGSNGTDHGSANNVFIIGENLKKQGFYNPLASLSNLDSNGDLKYTIDFRTIYATILANWLEVNDSKILNKSFNKLNFV